MEIKSFSFTGNRTIWISLQIKFFSLFLRPFPLKCTVFHVSIYNFFFSLLRLSVVYISRSLFLSLCSFHHILYVLNSEVAFLVPIEIISIVRVLRLCNIYCKNSQWAIFPKIPNERWGRSFWWELIILDDFFYLWDFLLGKYKFRENFQNLTFWTASEYLWILILKSNTFVAGRIRE